AEQIVAGPMTAVLVGEGHPNWDVCESELRISAVRRPRIILADARRAGLRSVLPRVRAELTRLWNEIEFPQLLTRLDIEAPNCAGIVVQLERIVAVNRR